MWHSCSVFFDINNNNIYSPTLHYTKERLLILRKWAFYDECVRQKIHRFRQKNLSTDEAHLWLDGYSNKQHARIWGDEQHEEVQDLNVTVNGDRYCAMIMDYLVPQIEARSLQDSWFQDGATCHTARESMSFLMNTILLPKPFFCYTNVLFTNKLVPFVFPFHTARILLSNFCHRFLHGFLQQIIIIYCSSQFIYGLVIFFFFIVPESRSWMLF